MCKAYFMHVLIQSILFPPIPQPWDGMEPEQAFAPRNVFLFLARLADLIIHIICISLLW